MLSILLSDPGSETVQTDDAVWVITGTGAQSITLSIDDSATVDTVIEEIQRHDGEHSVICVETNHDVPLIHAYRSVTSAHEIFYHENADGDMFITDHFRNSIARTAASERDVSEAAIADHLLYRTRPQGTYVSNIHRLKHGERLRWPIDAEPTTERIGTLAPTNRTRDQQSAIENINQGLSERVGQLSDEDDVVNMLSGGVDSSLLHTYLPADTSSVSAAFDSPEFEFEIDYAREASDILGTDHETLVEEETSFLQQLEQTIDAICLPPHHLQTVHMNICFRDKNAQTFVNGQFADALFGLVNAKHSYMAWLVRHGRHLIPPIGKLSRLRQLSSELTKNPSDPNGRALQFSIYTDEALLRETIDERAIVNRQQARLRYVRDIVELLPEEPTYTAHMDWGHWIDYYCDNAVSLWRHAALAHGKQLITPFTTNRLAQTAINIPADWRYRQKFEQKHLLKELLSQRLPEYPVSRSKGSGGLPLNRYLVNGPLADSFDKYHPPEFINEERAYAAMEDAPEFAWNLITFAIWRDRVLRHDDISLIPETEVITFKE